MKIHEHQGKELFRRFGVPVPKGGAAFSVEEALKIAEEIKSPVTVVKAQIHAGGRGKGGGVKLAKSPDEVRTYAESILGMNLVTHQTGPEGKIVKRLLIEEGSAIRRELYLGMVLDRSSKSIAVMASTEGGMEIEEVAAKTPEKILTIHTNATSAFPAYLGRELAFGLELEGKQVGRFVKLLTNLFRMFTELDASLVEINPLVVTEDGELIALDAKVNFDDNALFRHPDIAEMRDPSEEDPMELEAVEHGLTYIKLDGNIGCMVNGAGLAMATMDVIKYYGGEPANFLDVGGGANAQQVAKAFKIILSDENVEAILVNIFGGIMRCDVIAEGVIAAVKEVGLSIPLVVRLFGTNMEQGREMIANSGLNIIPAETLKDGAQKVVGVVKGGAA